MSANSLLSTVSQCFAAQDGSSGFQFGITTTSQSFAEGHNLCLQLAGGNAASIHSAQENDAVLNLFLQDGRSAEVGAWIGLRDPTGALDSQIVVTDRFFWVDGTTFSFGNVGELSPWTIGEPSNTFGNEDCVQLVDFTGDAVGLVWNDEECAFEKPMICRFTCADSLEPTLSPSTNPTKLTLSPTKSPTPKPSASPSKNPTKSPNVAPSPSPSKNPTKTPSSSPTKNPSASPTRRISNSPSSNPSASPISSTQGPSSAPTVEAAESTKFIIQMAMFGGILGLLALILFAVVFRRRSERKSQNHDSFDHFYKENLPIAKKISEFSSNTGDDVAFQSRRPFRRTSTLATRNVPSFSLFTAPRNPWRTSASTVVSPFGAQLPKPLRSKHPLPAHHLSVATASTSGNQLQPDRLPDESEGSSSRRAQSTNPRYRTRDNIDSEEYSFNPSSSVRTTPRYDFDF